MSALDYLMGAFRSDHEMIEGTAIDAAQAELASLRAQLASQASYTLAPVADALNASLRQANAEQVREPTLDEIQRGLLRLESVLASQAAQIEALKMALARARNDLCDIQRFKTFRSVAAAVRSIDAAMERK